MLTQGKLSPVPVRILLRRPRGGVWANIPVSFHLGEESFAATSDKLGLISLSLLPIPNKVLLLRVKDQTFGIVLERIRADKPLTFTIS